MVAAISARQLLGRNGIAHRWIDIERDAIARLLRAELLTEQRLPLIGAACCGVAARPRGDLMFEQAISHGAPEPERDLVARRAGQLRSADPHFC